MGRNGYPTLKLSPFKFSALLHIPLHVHEVGSFYNCTFAF